MRRTLKVLVILFATGALILAGTGIVLAASVVRSGVMTVAVEEHSSDGVRFTVPVPAALVEVGLSTLPLWMPDEEMARVRRELAPWQAPLREVARELEACPDVTLVRVETDREQVLVRKAGRYLKVTVHSEDADVRVSLPADAFSRVLAALS